MTTTIQHTCRPAEGDDGGRLLNLEHVRDCNISGCQGCLPCTPEHGHCRSCTVEHLTTAHPVTCPRCVGRVRNDILELLDKIVRAHLEQVNRSINSVLFMVAGPSSDYEAHTYVSASAKSGRLCKCVRRGLPMCLGEMPRLQGPTCDACRHDTCRLLRRPPVCPDAAFILEETSDDDRHPGTVLGAWAYDVARVLGHDPPLEPSLGANANYLLSHLTRLAQLPVEDFDFDEMRDDLAASHRWLEDLLRLGHRPDQAGWCPMCKRERLVKDWDPRHEHTPYNPRRDHTVYFDRWVCPNPECGQVYEPHEYRERLDLMYRQTADRLPAVEMAERLGIPPSTFRDWCATRTKIVEPVQVVDGKLIDAVKEVTPPRIRSCGRDAAGRKLYRVKDGERLRDRLKMNAS